MARGGPISRKRKTRNDKVKKEKKGSDESDEDYTVCEDELGDTEDEYCSSLAADDETDESLGEFEEQEDEDSEDQPLGSNSYRRRKKNGGFIPKNNKSAYDSDSDSDIPLSRTSSVRTPRKETRVPSTEKSRKNIVSYREEKYGGRFDDSDDESPLSSRFCVESPRKKTRFPSTENSRKKTIATNQEEKYDGSFNDSDDEPPFSSSFCVESPRKKTRVPSTGKCRKKTKISNQEDTFDGSFDDSDDEPPLSSRFCVESPRRKTRVSSTEKSRKKTIVSYREEKYDGDFDNSDEEDSDEEFAPEELDDDDDDDDESLVTKKNKEFCLRAHIGNEKKRKMNVKSWRKNKRKKPMNGKKFDDDVRRKRKVTEKGRRKKTNTNSDPDFVSSDYEYTISEEEREQIREAGIFCRRSTANLLTYDSMKTNGEEEIVVSQRKRQERKGKEKVVDTKVIEKGIQVCGICLSEEGKRSVRGILNCCSHFFCFACIMEWSKVESRCPLCKQRFATISRTARADAGRHVLKDDAVIPIPERDQVYQPSEEELRGYLYPYENVLCSECHHGGDDALMLLCDLCDSPAHTYCVGLGHEVPEGSWYCDGCRPITLLTSPTSQSLNNNNNNNNNNNININNNNNNNNNNDNDNNNPIPPDHTVNNNISMSPVRETFDLNELYIPETPLTQVNGGQSPLPRYSGGDPIPGSVGTVASTLFERRRIQRTVQQFFNNRRRRSDRNAAVAGISLFGSRIVSQQAPPVQVAGPLSVNNQDFRFHGLENPRQEFIHQESTSTDFYAFGRASHGELSGIGHPQLHPCNSRSNTGAEVSLSSPSSLDKEQVQSMVRRHLKSLSRNLDLGYNNFKNIARSSTHTILAAVGLEHRWNEVYPLRTQPLTCNHLASGQQLTHPVKGQCPSCFDSFVRNVVKEIMYA